MPFTVIVFMKIKICFVFFPFFFFEVIISCEGDFQPQAAGTLISGRLIFDPESLGAQREIRTNSQNKSSAVTAETKSARS